MLIDRFLSDYDIVEHHEVDVDAPVDRAYRAVKELDLVRSPIVLVLLFARGLPSMFTGAVKPKRRLGLDEIVDSGFVAPGFAKGAWNFVVSERPAGGSKVESETRVACTDDDARRRFSRYWRLIGPFSALIRRVMLRGIKHDAEGNR